LALPRLPSFDLVVATIGRVTELDRLLSSLDEQAYKDFRVLIVDQNGDDRVDGVLRRHASLDVVLVRAERGLSRARNAALGALKADVVAFPDDDCSFPSDLLDRIARRLADHPELDGLTGRAVDPHGSSSPTWAADPAVLTRTNLWNRGISYTIFLRRAIVERVGPFDEQLGLGSPRQWSSGEEIDYLVRAIGSGARIEYDPALVVLHDVPSLTPMSLRAIGARDGASVGYILRKHRYPPQLVARMMLRPAGGALLATLRRDRERAGFHVSTLRGRVLGYRHAGAGSS